MNAKIVKSVVMGESFIEHRFDPFMENFEGTWIKNMNMTRVKTFS